jgi:hypothetical protein
MSPHSWETMWTFKTKNFTVKWQITACTDLDLSWCETGETAENLASGLWTAFDSRVIVIYRGRIVGEDHLGQSIYENPADFRREGGYFPDMVREAIRQARFEMQNRPKLRAVA